MNRTKKNFNNDKPNNNNNKKKNLSNNQKNKNINNIITKEKIISKINQNESYNYQKPPKSNRSSSERIPLAKKKETTIETNLIKKDITTEKDEQKNEKEAKDSVTKKDIISLQNQISISYLELKTEIISAKNEFKSEFKKEFKDLKEVIMEGFEKLYSLFSSNKIKIKNKNESDKKSVEIFKIENNNTFKKENLTSKEEITSSSNEEKKYSDSNSNKIKNSSSNKNNSSFSGEYFFSL